MPRKTYRKRRAPRGGRSRGINRLGRGPGQMQYRAVKPSIARSLAFGTHYFKRSVNATTEYSANLYYSGNVYIDGSSTYFYMQSSGASGTKNYGQITYQFSLEHLPSLSDFTNLFDMYRITKVVVKIIPRSNSSANETTVSVAGYRSATDYSPNMHIVIDKDDVSAPGASEAGINALRQYPSYKVRRLQGGTTKIILTPVPNSTLYGYDDALVINVKKMGAWLNTSRTNIKHYGLKIIFDAINPNSNVEYQSQFEILTTYYFSMKGVR